MGLETATYIDSLVVSNPDGSDQRSTADDHLRLIKACLKRTFPQLDGIVSASAQAISYVNDLSASVQGQLNVLRDGAATANFAVSARFANSASAAQSVKSLSGTFSVSVENVFDKSGISNTAVGVLTGIAGPVHLANGTQTGIVLGYTAAVADEKYWRVLVGATGFIAQTINDAGSTARTFFQVTRNGNAANTISISAASVIINGIDANNPVQLNSVGAADYARLSQNQSFTKGTGSDIAQLVDAATIAVSATNANVHRMVLTTTGRAMGAPTGARAGQTIVFHIKQGGAGSYTMTWNSIYKFAGGSAPTLSTAVGAVDVFAFNYDGTDLVWRQAGLNVS